MKHKSAKNIANTWKELQKVEGDVLCKLVRKEMKLDSSDFGKLVGFKHPKIRISEIENKRKNLSNLARNSIIYLYTIHNLTDDIYI